MDSILIGWTVHLDHLMIPYMILSHSVSGQVLPYGCFFTHLFIFQCPDISDQLDRQTPCYYDMFTSSALGRIGIPSPETLLEAQQEEDEIRGMEARVNHLDHMEDDLHIPHL